VALAAISGGIGGSGSKLGVSGTGPLSNALRQGVASALSQGIGVVTGVQDKFSWAGVAAAGAGAWAAGAANINAPFNVVRSGASLIANAATRSLIEGSDFGDNVLAALPDLIGQTIGNMVAGGIAGNGRSGPSSAKDLYDQAADGLTPLSEVPGAYQLAGDMTAGGHHWYDGLVNAWNATLDFVGLDGTPGWQGPAARHWLWDGAGAGSGDEEIVVTARPSYGFVMTPQALQMLASGSPTVTAGGVNVASGLAGPAAGTAVLPLLAGGVAVSRQAGLYEHFTTGRSITPFLHIPYDFSITGLQGPSGAPNPLGFGVSVQSREEAALLADMQMQGASASDINSALDLLRGGRSARTASASDLRGWPGVAYVGGDQLPDIGDNWLRGTDGNVGIIPGQVAAQLAGQRFANFDAFREAFWTTVGNTPELASQFNRANQARMMDGYAPIAPESQHVGDQGAYVLHHIDPIQHGGGVYDMSNLLVVTPRYHQEARDPSSH